MNCSAAAGLGYQQHYSEASGPHNLNDTIWTATSEDGEGSGGNLHGGHAAELEVLHALDNDALQELIQASSASASSNSDLGILNCTETFWNVTLVKRDLRKNRTYVLVS